MKCDYCFYYDSEQSRRNKVINDAVLEQTIYELCKNNDEIVEFIWHGGEPLLLGLKRFRRIVSLQKKIRNKKQTIINKLVSFKSLGMVKRSLKYEC